MAIKDDAFKIAFSAINAVKGSISISKYVKRRGDSLFIGGKEFNLNKFENIYVIGAGKASASMAKGIEEILYDKITAGEVITKYGHIVPLEKIKLTEAAHPIPDMAGYLAACRIYELLKKATKKDLIIALISGGASALFPLPQEGITLEDKQKATSLLIRSGASIEEINVIRKHLSKIKGGKFVEIAYPATILSFIISDVVDDKIESIASGLTVPDESSYNDCLKIIKKYELDRMLPKSIIEFINNECQKENIKKRKHKPDIFKKVTNFNIANNLLAAEAAKVEAEKLGYNSIILSSRLEGEVEEMAKLHCSIIKEIIASGNPIKKPACLISGGEGTISVRGPGKGGRNMHFALVALTYLKEIKNYFLLSFGTDGTDGITDAAGAFIYSLSDSGTSDLSDSGTWQKAAKLKLDPFWFLLNYDSYSFFEKLGDLFITGPTETNVMDLRIILIC